MGGGARHRRMGGVETESGPWSRLGMEFETLPWWRRRVRKSLYTRVHDCRIPEHSLALHRTSTIDQTWKLSQSHCCSFWHAVWGSVKRVPVCNRLLLETNQSVTFSASHKTSTQQGSFELTANVSARTVIKLTGFSPVDSTLWIPREPCRGTHPYSTPAVCLGATVFYSETVLCPWTKLLVSDSIMYCKKVYAVCMRGRGGGS